MGNKKLEFLSHSQAKVELLNNYIKRYLNIISNLSRIEQIYIYDLFCGPGIYEEGGEGSPICFLKNIKDLHYINVAKNNDLPKITCFFNDKNTEIIQNLNKNIDKYGYFDKNICDVIYLNKSYEELITSITKSALNFHLQNIKSFIFIDPFGYSEIKPNHIKELLNTRNTEILLWLPIQFMYRFEKKETPKALAEFLNQLAPNWDWKETNNVFEFLNQLKQYFQIYLGDEFFVDNFIIKKDKHTVFCLLFFSSHIKGFEKMLEAKWEIDTEFGEGWHYSGNQLTLFSDYNTNPLEEAIIDFLNLGKKTNIDLYKFVLNQGFLPKHLNEILRKMQNIKTLSVTNLQGEKLRKGSFYINYEFFKKKEIKSIFEII